MLTNTPVEDDVPSSPSCDPRIPDVQELAASTVDGAVTLRATVGAAP